MELSSPSTPPPRELAVVTRFTPERPGLPHQPSVEGPHGFGLVGVCTQLLGPRGALAACPPPAQAGLVRREHHDSVLHDRADAGLCRGLLHLQPHTRRPPELLPDLCQQRLLLCRSLSQPAGSAQGGPLGPALAPQA